MIITHNTAKADQKYITRTTYTLEDNTLTRILRSTVQTVQLKPAHTIADLYRLSSMDDETFVILAELQDLRSKKQGEPQHESN